MVEETALGFGLGGGDSARLFPPMPTPTTATIDSYTWTAHAPVTYGRCPNGTGAFINTTTATKGAANDCGPPPPPPADVVINEVESDAASPGDWVELYNRGTTAADISGYVFRDNGATGYTCPRDYHPGGRVPGAGAGASSCSAWAAAMRAACSPPTAPRWSTATSGRRTP